ncbi:MAG TPA: peptidoglycan-binding domain-containing protein [Stellaceae bacterium]|nr:peptidoglycan-binding domain-containing protein [Stellaceae bacterium]
MRKFILGTASVLALGIGGAALDFAANGGDFPNAGPGTSRHWLDVGNLSKDDIRWAQVELHYNGLYNGSLDGVVGPETTRALLAFQKSNGLPQTASLDQQTADALVGDIGVGEGSSLPPKRATAGSLINPSGAGASDLGSRGGQK